jgi:hypothetical protein
MSWLLLLSAQAIHAPMIWVNQRPAYAIVYSDNRTSIRSVQAAAKACGMTSAAAIIPGDTINYVSVLGDQLTKDRVACLREWRAAHLDPSLKWTSRADGSGNKQ